LNDSVTACSWPTWFTAVGLTVRSTVGELDSGTSTPLLLRTEMSLNARSSSLADGVTSRITW